ERHKHLVHVPAVIAGVLLLFLHYSDDGVRKFPDLDGLPDRLPRAKQLLLHVAAQERHPPRLRQVLPAIKAALGDRQAAHLGERRSRTRDGESSVVIWTGNADISLPKLRQNVAALRGF